MAIHLILWGINEVHQGLKGSVHILLDCLGALDKVENLPLLGEVRMNVRVLVLGSTSTHECKSAGTQEY
jgi:hypothetical protein